MTIVAPLGIIAGAKVVPIMTILWSAFGTAAVVAKRTPSIVAFGG
jgi:hypothetical protein